jgi:hypothetical protein
MRTNIFNAFAHFSLRVLKLLGFIPRPRTAAITHPISPEMKAIGRVLITENEALEILLMLDDEGPSCMNTLIKEVIPENRLLKVISELSRCDLVEVIGDKIALTSKGKKIIATLQSNPKE